MVSDPRPKAAATAGMRYFPEDLSDMPHLLVTPDPTFDAAEWIRHFETWGGQVFLVDGHVTLGVATMQAEYLRGAIDEVTGRPERIAAIQEAAVKMGAKSIPGSRVTGP